MFPRGTTGAMVLLALVASAAWHAPAPAFAQAAPLRYEVTRGCPSRSYVESALRERVPGERLGALAAMRVVRAGRGVRGELTVALAGGPSRRALRARTCREAVDALVLVAAVLLGPAGAPPDGSDRDTDATAEEPVAAGTPDATSVDGAAQPTETQTESDVAPPANPARQAPAEAPPAAEEETRESPVKRKRLVWARPDRGPWQSTLDTQVGALLLGGVAPGLRPGAALSLGFATGPERPVRLDVRAGLRGSLPSEVAAAEGRATFRFLAGTLAVGPTLAPARRLSLTVAALAELGRLSVRSEGVRNARASHRPWRAIGPTVTLVLALSRRLSLAAAGELMVPLVTDRFLVAGELLHRVPELTFRTELALRVGIW